MELNFFKLKCAFTNYFLSKSFIIFKKFYSRSLSQCDVKKYRYEYDDFVLSRNVLRKNSIFNINKRGFSKIQFNITDIFESSNENLIQ